MKTKNIIITTCCVVIISLIIIATLLLKTPTYDVTFNSNNQVYETVEVKENGTVEEPAAPTKEGYKFIGWYLNGEKFDFSTKVTKDIELVARWEKINEDIDLEDDKSTTNTTTTTKKRVTKKTTKKVTNKVEEKPAKPVTTTTTKQVEKTTKKIVTTTSVPTTTKVDISYDWDALKDDTAGQSILYLTKNGTRVAGTCDITFNSGKTVNIDVPSTGYITVKSIVNKITNIKVK